MDAVLHTHAHAHAHTHRERERHTHTTPTHTHLGGLGLIEGHHVTGVVDVEEGQRAVAANHPLLLPVNHPRLCEQDVR